MRRTMNGSKSITNREKLAYAKGYIRGRLEDQFNSVAAASGGAFSGTELAAGVAADILSDTSGGLLGHTEHLSKVRKESTGPRKAVASKKVGVRVSSKSPVKQKRQMSAAARKRISAAQKARWAEWHKNKKAA